MPNAKTTLRVAMAAVAAPGIIAGMAAPAAHAAELPTMETAQGQVSDAQHASLADAQQQAQHKATSMTHQASTQKSVQTTHGDLTGSHVLQTGNMLNGQDMSL